MQINLLFDRATFQVIHGKHHACFIGISTHKIIHFWQYFRQRLFLVITRAFLPCPEFKLKFYQVYFPTHSRILTDIFLNVKYLFSSVAKTKHNSFPKRRRNANERGYNYKWQKVSKLFLQENPLCKFCSDAGVVRSADVVDHITPHKGDMDLFWDPDNWQGLCIPCHNITKQIMERGNLKRIGIDGYPIEDNPTKDDTHEV